VLAPDLISLIARARRDRVIHVVADGAYVCKTLRHLPANATLTGPLPRNAALWQIHPDLDDPPCMRGRRGRPSVRGAKIGTPDQLATTPGKTVTLTRYGRVAEVTITSIDACGTGCSAPNRSGSSSYANPAARAWLWSPPKHTPPPPRS